MHYYGEVLGTGGKVHNFELNFWTWGRGWRRVSKPN